MPKTVLIIDDEEAISWSLRKACEREGYTTAVAATAEDGLALAQSRPPDVVLLDVKLPGMDGLTALEKFQTLAPDAAVIVITAHGNLSTAVRAVSGGAFDYLSKPFDLDQALEAIRRAANRQDHGSGDSAESIVEIAQNLGSEDTIIGHSPAMQHVFKRIALVAPTDACVLITGESGTGKELVARAIHANSPRRSRAFLPVHLAAINPSLVESELFGHVKGAFTGADRSRPGLLTLADGGTIFLDELADIPLPVQAKLLRVLERQEVLPVGGTEAHRVNIRVISATHADLAKSVANGTFRHDLFFRLSVYPIHLPSLADRLDDIPQLAEYFLRKFVSPGTGTILPADTIQNLKSRPWPGNVRELRNALEYAAILARGGPIRPEHFPAPLAITGKDTTSQKLAGLIRQWVREHCHSEKNEEPRELYQALLEVMEPALLSEVLREVDGNRLVAARWLGLARATVRKLIRKYQLASALDDPEDKD